MRVQLASISPVSFMIAKEGELVSIQHRPPKLNEYREKIGPAAECYLVFKGKTKLGMIPKKIVKDHKELLVKKNCRIIKIDQANSIFIVELTEPLASQGNDEIKSA
jgi:hypothetical protein